MKKILLFVLILCLAGCVSKQMEDVTSEPVIEKPTVVTDTVMNDSKDSVSDKEILLCEKNIEKIKNESELYNEKSNDAKLKNELALAAIYTELAGAKAEMAKGMEGILKASVQCKAIYSKNPELMKNICSMDMQNSIIMKKKMDINEYGIKLQKCIQKCENYSVEADEKGDGNLAGQYGNMEAALTDKLKAVQMYSTGERNYKRLKGNEDYYKESSSNYKRKDEAPLPKN